MIALDTNVLYRFLADDPTEPSQVAAARKLIAGAKATGDPIFIPLLTLVETTWVLRSAGGDRATVAEAVRLVLDATQFVVEEAALIEAALARYRKGKADFADYVILGESQRGGATALYTFDRKLKRSAGVAAPVL